MTSPTYTSEAATSPGTSVAASVKPGILAGFIYCLRFCVYLRYAGFVW